MVCAQSFELNRVLGGEIAQRSEVARRAADLERRLQAAHYASVQEPGPNPPHIIGLQQEHAQLQEKIQQLSAQVG